MKITVSYAGDETKEAEITAGDFVAFERKYDVSWDDVEAKPRIEHTFFLAWNALRRTGQEARTFDDFIDAVVDLDGDEDPKAQPNRAQRRKSSSPK